MFCNINSGIDFVRNFPERYSIAYFCTPDLDHTIECLPGCEGNTGSKYPPINSGEYLMKRIKGHY